MRSAIFLAAALSVAHMLGAQNRSPSLRDSAGVQIVEHATIKNAPVLDIVAQRASLDLGGLKNDPREEFDARQPMIGVARLSDGRLVANSYSDVKIFDRNGKFVQVIGRAGSGPGEFGQLKSVCAGAGDTIIVINYNRPRISVFDAAGKHVRDFNVSGYVPEGGCFGDGTILVRTNSRPDPALPAGSPQASISARVSDGERIGMDGRPRGLVGTFADETVFGFQTVGNSYVQGALIYAGDGRTAEVRLHDTTGKMVRIVRWKDPVIPVTPALIEKDAASSIPNNVTAEERSRRMALARSRPYPPHLPMYSKISADPSGRLWVMDPFTDPLPRGWTLFSADGSLLGRVLLPNPTNIAGSRVDLSGFVGSYAVLRWRDSDGALHITLHTVSGLSER